MRHLPTWEVELNDEIAQLETDIENGAGDVSELRCRIASLESQLESTGQKLADLSTFGRFRRKNRDKLKLADRQLSELQDKLDALSEKRDNAQKKFPRVHGKESGASANEADRCRLCQNGCRRALND